MIHAVSQSTAPPQSDEILRVRAVSRRIGLSKATIYRLIGAGDFPRPVRLTTATVGWFASEIDAWMGARARTE